jgi:transposase
VRRVSCRGCGAVKREHLPWLADNPFYTKRFAYYVGRRCRASTIRDVARELRLDWRTVKALEMEYMGEQLRRAGTPGPKVLGIDELSIGRGHNYRIIVSDLVRGRPIWFGGTDRSEKSMDLFFQWLGPRKCKGIRLAVMDMWKPFRNSTLKAGNAPQAEILYDKFHILKHLNEALDKVRKSEYARLSGKDRKFIKGQKYTLLSRRANLTQEGRQSLKAVRRREKGPSLILAVTGASTKLPGCHERDNRDRQSVALHPETSRPAVHGGTGTSGVRPRQRGRRGRESFPRQSERQLLSSARTMSPRTTHVT